MKKLLLLLTLFVGLSSAAWAQVCTPDTAGFTAGAFANPASLPCIQQTAAYAATLTIRIPDSIDAHVFDTAVPAGSYYLYVDSLALDSVTGAPVGINAAINPGSTVFLHAGDYGCVQFSGTTNTSLGNYTLSLYGNGCAHGSISGIPLDSCYQSILLSYFSYTLNVCALAPICTPDTSAFTTGVNIFPAFLPCISPGSPYSGTVSIRVPDSIDASLFNSALPGGTYFVHVDSIRMDSITGMPSGINAASLPGSSTWLHGGDFACALFSGTTNATAGYYPINVFVKGCVHGTFPVIGYIDTCTNQNLATLFNFTLSVCNGPACTVDTTHFSGGTYVYPTQLPCIITDQAYSGQVNIQVPDSLDISQFITGFTVPPGRGFAHIDSIDITTVTGLPTGINLTTNPGLHTWLHPSDVACAVFAGTVSGAITPAGAYPLIISGTACGYTHDTLHSGGITIPINIDTCMQNYSFAKIFPYSLNVCYPAGISQVTEGINLSIYPNPNQGHFTVSISSADRVSGTMTVLDQLGRVLRSQNIDVTGTQQIPLDMGSISAGAYLLMIHTGQNRSVKQFIVR